MKIADARARAGAVERLHIFITMTDEDGPGEVVAVKDLIDVCGTPTTAGWGGPTPDPQRADAPLVAALRQSGCVVIGKTNLHEWAFGVTNINPHHGAVGNPRDERRISGGSSGGSAAAVAAGVCAWAIGTDTGGSIRIPASLCGVVGFKPTWGTIDTAGVLPLSISLDTVGSLAPDVRTAVRGVEMMAGQQGWTPTGAPAWRDLRLAVPAGWVSDLDETVGAVWRTISAGLPEIDLPSRSHMSKLCLDLMYAEAGAFHRQRMAEHPERYGADVLARLRSTFKVSGADHVDAVNQRERLAQAVNEAMRGYDALLLPATASVAPLIAEGIDVEPLTHFARPFNYTGQPSFSIPASSPGLPVGIQVVGRRGQDAELARVALATEAAWSSDKPAC